MKDKWICILGRFSGCVLTRLNNFLVEELVDLVSWLLTSRVRWIIRLLACKNGGSRLIFNQLCQLGRCSLHCRLNPSDRCHGVFVLLLCSYPLNNEVETETLNRGMDEIAKLLPVKLGAETSEFWGVRPDNTLQYNTSGAQTILIQYKCTTQSAIQC